MLNKDLFDDKKDIEILRLKRIIHDFKIYDTNRTNLISTLQTEIGELKSYIEELESNDIIINLKNKIKCQTEELKKLNNNIRLNNIISSKDDDNILIEIDRKTQIKKLNKLIKNKQKECDTAWSTAAKYKHIVFNIYDWLKNKIEMNYSNIDIFRSFEHDFKELINYENE